MKEMQEKQTPYFPLFINLSGKKIMLVGLGKVAVRRIHTLLPFEPEVLVITKEIPEECQKEAEMFIEKGVITCLRKEFEDTDLNWNPDIVIVATDSARLNAYIGETARAKGALVNVASDCSLCDFYFPAMARTESVTVGVTGNGKNHKEVAHVTEQIRRMLHL